MADDKDNSNIFTLDDFSVTQEYLTDAKKFTRLAVKKDYEVILTLEDLEILERDLRNNSQDPQIARLTNAIIDAYKKHDKNINLLAQDQFIQDYLNNKYHLRWLVPLVSDFKQVYKKETANLSPLNKLESKTVLSNTLKAIVDFDWKPRNPAQVIDALINYIPNTGETRRNPLGNNVLRPSGIDSANGTDLELRGTQGDVISHEYLYKTRGKGEGRVIIGKKDFVLVPSEKLNVIGYAKLPAPRKIDSQVKWGLEVKVEKITPKNTPADTLRKFIPTIENLIESYNTNGVIDITVFFELFKYYGHPIQSLTSYNRKRINEIIQTNLDLLPTQTYQIKQRKYISFLEEQLTKYETPIITNQILTSDTLSHYKLIRDPLLSTRFMIFHEIMKQADNGLIWLTQIANQSLTSAKKRTFKLKQIISAQVTQTKCPPSQKFQGLVIGVKDINKVTSSNHHEICIWDSSTQKYISKKDYLEKLALKESTNLFIPNLTFDPQNIKHRIRNYKVVKAFVFKHHELLNSYYNLWIKTPNHPELLQALENPLDNLFGYRADIRDRMAWFSFFKKATPDRYNQNYLFKGKWIGCQHEYDRLYQKFVNPDDSFPFSKRYTRVIAFNGVICGFCGETIKEQDDLTEHGFDQFGRRVQITSGNLTGIESSIRNFFVNKDENITWASKTVDLWNGFTNEIPSSSDQKREIQNPQKYAILKRYQDFSRDNVFISGLAQNPLQLPVRENQILTFLLNTIKLDKTKVTAEQSFLLEYLLNLFKTIHKTYELLIQRLAALMVSVRWYLIRKDASYLNLNTFLQSFEKNTTLLGQVMLGMKFGPKYNAELKNMGQRTLATAIGANDKTYPKYYQAFIRSYQHSFKKLSAKELDAKIQDKYLKLIEQFFYNQNVENSLFNGNFPYEHEIIRIFNEYLTSQGGNITINELLKSSFTKYWKQWIESDDFRSQEVDRIRQNQIIVSGEEFLYEAVDRKNGLLYQKFLGQQNWVMIKQIEQLYMELINESIYLIGDAKQPLNQMGGMDVATKKRYYLGKMLCENWQDLTDLDVTGVESFTLILDEIKAVKIRQSALGVPSFHLIWPYIGRGFARDNRLNPYQIIKTGFQTPLVEKNTDRGKTRGLGGLGNIKFSKPGQFKMPAKGDLDLGQYFNELKFVPKIQDLVEVLGGISYIKDMKETIIKVRNILEKRGLPVQVCHEDKYTPKNKIGADVLSPHEFLGDRMRMLNLKKYLISYLRFYVELFSRINRDQLSTYGLQYKYKSLMKSVDFNEAFSNFKIEIPNQDVLEFINFNMDKPNQWKVTSHVLLFLIIHDLSRHLRTLRLEATKYVKKVGGQKRRGGLSKYEIFQEFVKNFFQELEFDHQVQNVEWNHKQINQTLIGSILAEKQSKIKSKDSIEWGIMKFKLNVEETQRTIDASGPDLDTNVVKGADLDVEDTMEMDFDLGDDGNDYSE